MLASGEMTCISADGGWAGAQLKALAPSMETDQQDEINPMAPYTR